MKVNKPVTGSLIEKGGYYHTVINARVDGKRKQISRTTGLPIKNNYRKAQKILEDRKREYDEHGLTGMLIMEERNEAQNMLLTDYMLKWIERNKKEWSDSYYRGKKRAVEGKIRRFFDPLGVTITSLTPQMFEDFLDELSDDGLSGSTLLTYYQSVKQCLETAIRKDYLVKNPLSKVDRPKKGHFSASYYSKEEAQLLLEAAADDVCYMPVLLATYYGMRRSEAIGLKWSSIDFDNNQIHINHKAYAPHQVRKQILKILLVRSSLCRIERTFERRVPYAPGNPIRTLLQ